VTRKEIPNRPVNLDLAMKDNLESYFFSFPQVNFLKISFFPNKLIPNQKTLANNHVHKNMYNWKDGHVHRNTNIHSKSISLIITIVYTQKDPIYNKQVLRFSLQTFFCNFLFLIVFVNHRKWYLSYIHTKILCPTSKA
jgi:hypothetical protein